MNSRFPLIRPLMAAGVLGICLTACSDTASTAQHANIKPGTVVAHDEYAITEDTLNKAMHTITVVADSAIDKGVYNVDVSFGKNFAHGGFTMPKGGEQLKPLIRRGTGHTFIIGFRMKDDTTFYDYVEVAGSKENTRIQYLNSYTLQ